MKAEDYFATAKAVINKIREAFEHQKNCNYECDACRQLLGINFPVLDDGAKHID